MSYDWDSRRGKAPLTSAPSSSQVVDCNQVMYDDHRVTEREATTLDTLRRAVPQLGGNGSLQGSGDAGSFIKVEEVGGDKMGNMAEVGPVPSTSNEANPLQLPARARTGTSTTDTAAIGRVQCCGQQGSVVVDPHWSTLGTLGGSPPTALGGDAHQQPQGVVPIKAEVAYEMNKPGPVGLEMASNTHHGQHPRCGSLYQDGPPRPVGAGKFTLGTPGFIHDLGRFCNRDAEVTHGMPSVMGGPGCSGVISEGFCSRGGRHRGLEHDVDAALDGPLFEPAKGTPNSLGAQPSMLPKGAESRGGDAAR